MRWKGRAPQNRKTDWEPWFAWFPVKTINATWVWLEWVDRVYYSSSNITNQEYKNCSGMDYACRARKPNSTPSPSPLSPPRS